MLINRYIIHYFNNFFIKVMFFLIIIILKKTVITIYDIRNIVFINLYYIVIA